MWEGDTKLQQHHCIW